MQLYERPPIPRAYGGRGFKSRGFCYKYDVWICFYSDLIVDCLYTLNRFGKPFEMSFWMMYELITDTEEHPFYATFSQVTGRILGAALWAFFIKSISNLICNAF